MSLTFEWDPRKAVINAQKHGIAFSEATAVFDDPLAKIFLDVWHSQSEQREIIIGHLPDRRLCVVVFAEISEGHLRMWMAVPTCALLVNTAGDRQRGW